MKDYNYKLLLDDLADGREIEFNYNGIPYAIVNIVKGWYFVGNHKQIGEFYDNPHELVKTIAIDGKSIEEIFNSGDIPDEGFYIL
jgi:hypothetical protein